MLLTFVRYGTKLLLVSPTSLQFSERGSLDKKHNFEDSSLAQKNFFAFVALHFPWLCDVLTDSERNVQSSDAAH